MHTLYACAIIACVGVWRSVYCKFVANRCSFLPHHHALAALRMPLHTAVLRMRMQPHCAMHASCKYAPGVGRSTLPTLAVLGELGRYPHQYRTACRLKRWLGGRESVTLPQIWSRGLYSYRLNGKRYELTVVHALI